MYSVLLYAVIATALLTTAWLGAAPAENPPKISSHKELLTGALAHEPCSETDHACTAATAASRVDLATRLEIDPDQIELLRKDRVTWNSGSLGCPQPNLMYSQAVVDGLFIELRVCQTSYYYHASREGTPFLCVQPHPADDGSQLS